jgi:hypothetical protein
MFIEVFQRISGFLYKSVAILDGWNSLTIEENYYSCDTFELTIALNKDNIQNFQPENVFFFDNVYYYVDEISSTDSSSTALVVRGRSLAGKFESRIIDRIYTASKSPALIVYDHFNQEMIAPGNYSDSTGNFNGATRKIDYLILSATDGLGLDKIDYQTSYQEVQSQVEVLCQTYDFGFREIAVDDISPKNKITIYKGRDLSGVIEISDDFDNLINVTYEHATYDEKTTAYGFGEGEGANRVKVVVNPNKSGLERKELYVDARDLQSVDPDTEKPIPAATYKNMLIDRSKQKLAERLAILTMNGEIELNSKLFKFKEDFDVGDRIKIKSNLYQFAKIVTIVKAKKTYDATGYYVELVFDKEVPTVFDIIGRN